MNALFTQTFFAALFLALTVVISGTSAASNFSGFPGLRPEREAGQVAPAGPQPRTLSPIVGGTCKIVCDGVYQKYKMENMKVILPCDSACKVVDLLAEGFTEAFVVAISGPGA